MTEQWKKTLFVQQLGQVKCKYDCEHERGLITMVISVVKMPGNYRLNEAGAVVSLNEWCTVPVKSLSCCWHYRIKMMSPNARNIHEFEFEY